MRQRSYLASVASPIGAGEAPAFPLYRPAPEDSRPPAGEPRAAESSPAASPPRTVRRKLAKAIPAGESYSLVQAANPLAPAADPLAEAAGPALGPTATSPIAPIRTASEDATPDATKPSATLQPFERAAQPLAVDRPEVTPFATSSFAAKSASAASAPPTPYSEPAWPAVFAAGEATLSTDPGLGSLGAAAAALPNSGLRASQLGDPIVAPPPPRPRDPGAPPSPTDPFSPPPAAAETRQRFPRVEIGLVEVRGAPAPQPPPPVAAAAPGPSGPVARGYGWRYGLYQG